MLTEPLWQIGQFHHFGFAWKDVFESQFAIYVDGVKQDEASYTAEAISGPWSTFRIGNNFDGDRNLDGLYIDEVKIHKAFLKSEAMMTECNGTVDIIDPTPTPSPSPSPSPTPYQTSPPNPTSDTGVYPTNSPSTTGSGYGIHRTIFG